MNADQRGLFLRALPAVLLVAVASVAVSVVALLDLPSAADWLSALIEAGAPRERLLFTLVQAAGATALGLVLGLLASWFLARPGMPLASVFLGALLVPVAVPGIAFALGLRELGGTTFLAAALVVWAHAAFTAGVTAWVVTPAWGASDGRLVDQAVLLGAPRWRARLASARRAVARNIVLAAALGFTNAAAAVGTVMVLGDEEIWTVEALLLREATGGNVGVAPSLAGIQLLLGLVAYLGAWRWTERPAHPSRIPGPLRVAGVLTLLALSALALAPVVALVVGAARVEEGASSAFSGLLDADLVGNDVGGMLGWSAVYALTGAVVATALAWLASPYVAASRRSWWRGGLGGVPIALLALALLVSPVVAALGARELFEALDVDLQRTWAVMAAVHVLVAFPVALRVLTSAARPDGHRLIEAAVLLGQSDRAAAWRWRRRLTLRAVLASLLIVVAFLLGEVGAVALLAPTTALPATAGLLAAAPPDVDVPPVALAVATILSGVAVVAFMLGEWVRRRATGALRTDATLEGR